TCTIATIFTCTVATQFTCTIATACTSVVRTITESNSPHCTSATAAVLEPIQLERAVTDWWVDFYFTHCKSMRLSCAFWWLYFLARRINNRLLLDLFV